jgi:hypothetical protein
MHGMLDETVKLKRFNRNRYEISPYLSKTYVIDINFVIVWNVLTRGGVYVTKIFLNELHAVRYTIRKTTFRFRGCQ